MPKVINIVVSHLVQLGADGLVNIGECGCLLDDLVPCGGDFSRCEPGWKGVDRNEPGDWAMYFSKDAAEKSKQEQPPEQP